MLNLPTAELYSPLRLQVVAWGRAMDDQSSLLSLLRRSGDWLAATVIISLLVSSVVGWHRRSKGMALLMSHVASGILAVVLFLLGVSYKHDVLLIAAVAGPLSGAFSYAAFRLLISISDRAEARSSELADRVLDRFVPGGDKETPR